MVAPVKMSGTLFVSLILVLNVLAIESSLTCYTCAVSVGINDRCVNPSLSGDTLPYTTCLHSNAVCAKYVIEYGDSVMMHRGCYSSDVCAGLTSSHNNFYTRVLECQTCNDHNYCNNGNHKSFSFVTIAFMASFTLIYFFRSIVA